MAEAVLCLDIRQSEVRAVVLDRSARVTIVKGCAVVKTAGISLSETFIKVKEECRFKGGSCLVTLGPEFFSYRNLSLPFTDRKKIAQVLPYELVDFMPTDITGLLVDFLIAGSDREKSDVLALLLKKEIMAEYLAALQAGGLNPNTIGLSGLPTAMRLSQGPNDSFILIDCGPVWAGIFLVRDGKTVLIRPVPLPEDNAGQSWVDFVNNVRQTYFASHLRNLPLTDLPVYLTGEEHQVELLSPALTTGLYGVEVALYSSSRQPLMKIDPALGDSYHPGEMDCALASGLKMSGKTRTVNFRKDEFSRFGSLHEYRRILAIVAVPLVVALVVAVGYFGHEYKVMQEQHEALKQQIAGVFRETVPEVTRIVNPVQQLQIINSEILQTYRPGGDSSGGYTVIELLTELSTRILPTLMVRINRMVADQRIIRIKAVTGDFNTVDNVQKELEKSSYFKKVDITSANQSAQGDEVRFELKIELISR